MVALNYRRKCMMRENRKVWIYNILGRDAIFLESYRNFLFTQNFFDAQNIADHTQKQTNKKKQLKNKTLFAEINELKLNLMRWYDCKKKKNKQKEEREARKKKVGEAKGTKGVIKNKKSNTRAASCTNNEHLNSSNVLGSKNILARLWVLPNPKIKGNKKFYLIFAKKILKRSV